MALIASTSTPLGGNATYTSPVFPTAAFSYLSGSVFADQAGTIYIEQSGDGTHWDLSTNYAVSASDGSGFKEEVILPWGRIRFVNGAAAQGTFRLFTQVQPDGNRF